VVVGFDYPRCKVYLPEPGCDTRRPGPPLRDERLRLAVNYLYGNAYVAR